MLTKEINRLLSKEINRLIKEIKRLFSKGVNRFTKEIKRLLSKGINSLLVKGMSNIYLKLPTEKNRWSQTFDFLS